jgi:hypothetical protein
MDEDFSADPVAMMNKVFNFTGLAQFDVDSELTNGAGGANLGSTRPSNVTMLPEIKQLLDALFLPHTLRLVELLEHHIAHPRHLFDSR